MKIDERCILGMNKVKVKRKYKVSKKGTLFIKDLKKMWKIYRLEKYRSTAPSLLEREMEGEVIEAVT